MMWERLFLFSLGFSSSMMAGPIDPSLQKQLALEGKAIYQECLEIASEFYSLSEDEDLKEMTEAILTSPKTEDGLKQKILSTGRRFFLFKYPSDGYQVKGYLSFVSEPSNRDLLLFLRGGHKIFGLPHPATDLTCMEDYTVLITTYRGGVSDGMDQHGGEEVSDIENMLKFLPELSKKLDVNLAPKNTYMLGRGRGAMEMFLALDRSVFLKERVKKAVSLSGVLDLQECISYRSEVKESFIKYFGLIPEVNEESWIASRNPIHVVPHLPKDLPFLILQGTDSPRSSPKEADHMVQKLKEHGIPFQFVEVPGGGYALENVPTRAEMISHWLKSN